MIDALEHAGGTLTLEEIAAALGISRPRDVRRKDGPLARLEAAAVVECSGDTVSLAADWRDALADERERPAEDGSGRGDSRPVLNPAHDAAHNVAPESPGGTIHFLRELISVRTETPPPEGDLNTHPPDCECPECSVLANRHAKSAA